MACNCQSIITQSTGRKPTSTATRALAGLSIAGGLLSSSCCLIQLIFNVLRLGCAGFAILTPWQTHLRTLTVLSLAHLVYRDGLNRRSLLTVALTVALMFSQDAVRLHNLHTGLAPPSPPPTPPGEEARRSASTPSPLPSQQARRTEAVAPNPTPPKPHSGVPGPDSHASSPSSPDTHAPDQGQDQEWHQQDDSQTGPNPHRPATPDRAAEARWSSPSTGTRQGPSETASETTAGAGKAGSTTPASQSSSPSSTCPSSGPGGGDACGGSGSGSGVYMRFRVEGIKCEGCAARLKTALLGALGSRGLQRCAVDFGSGTVLVWGAPGGELSEAEVRAAIQFVDLSYRVTLVESRGL